MNMKITNPMLVGIIELMRIENTPERRRVFMEEVAKATLITPAYVEARPGFDENGEIAIKDESRIQMPMLSSKDGEKFFMAFTDIEEMKKFLRGNAPHVLALKFDELYGMVMEEGTNACGFVINPQTSNIVINKETLKAIRLVKEQLDAGY